MNGLFNSTDLNGDEIGDGDLSVFGLPDIKSSRALLVVEVVYLLVIDFVEGNRYLGVHSILQSLHDHLKRSGEDSSFLAGKEMVNVLLVIFTQ